MFSENQLKLVSLISLISTSVPNDFYKKWRRLLSFFIEIPIPVSVIINYN